MTRTKVDIINKVASIGLSKKKAAEAVNATFETIKDALAGGEKVQLVGFGNFLVREKPAHKARNPQTGAEITIAAKKVPVFKAGIGLREAVK